MFMHDVPHLTVAASDPFDDTKMLMVKIKEAEIALAKSPNYGNARDLQKLKRDRQALINASRKRMTLAYDFNDAIVEQFI